MQKKGQVATEYLFVIGFSTLIMAGLLIFFGQEADEQTRRASSGQVNQIGSTIMKHAEEVYYLGWPTKRTLSIYMPSDVRAVDIMNDELIFTLYEKHESVFSSGINLTGKINPGSGMKTIEIIALKDTQATCIKEAGMDTSAVC